jgi:xyloglucan-specific exo-beta-1,4-glucanase
MLLTVPQVSICFTISRIHSSDFFDSGGTIALSADGDTVLWSSSNSGVLVSSNSGAYTEVDLPDFAIITSDKLDNAAFYAASGGSFYISTDGGATFAQTETLGESTSAFEIAANPFTAGDVWASTDKGLFHSTGNGTEFAAVEGIGQAWAVALGAPASVSP